MSEVLLSIQSDREQADEVVSLDAYRGSTQMPHSASQYAYAAANAFQASNDAVDHNHPQVNGPTDMDDKDVQRLEDRITASEERSRLRLEAVVERIEGSLTRIADQTVMIRQEFQEQRADGRALRAEVGQVVVGVRSELKDQLDSHKTTERTHFQWVMGTVIVMGIGLASLFLGLGQIWGSGAQFGQSAERYLQEALHEMQDSIRNSQPKPEPPANPPSGAPVTVHPPSSAKP